VMFYCSLCKLISQAQVQFQPFPPFNSMVYFFSFLLSSPVLVGFIFLHFKGGGGETQDSVVGSLPPGLSLNASLSVGILE